MTGRQPPADPGREFTWGAGDNRPARGNRQPSPSSAQLPVAATGGRSPRTSPHPRDVARSTTSDVAAGGRRVDPEARRRRAQRRRFLTLAAVIVAVLAIGAGALGAFLNPFKPEAPPVTIATPTTGPGAPGFVSGGQLTAGQCFATFSSAWQDEFELADCGAPHAAELYAIVAATEYGAEPDHPGDEALRSEAMRACQSPAAIDMAAAAEIADLQIEAAYPMTQAEWDAGVRHYWCFASRASGEPLETTLTLAE